MHSFLHYVYFIYNVHCVALQTPNNISKSYTRKSPIHCWDNKPQGVWKHHIKLIFLSTDSNTGY